MKYMRDSSDIKEIIRSNYSYVILLCYQNKWGPFPKIIIGWAFLHKKVDSLMQIHKCNLLSIQETQMKLFSQNN